jgi:hypothetical protein
MPPRRAKPRPWNSSWTTPRGRGHPLHVARTDLAAAPRRSPGARLRRGRRSSRSRTRGWGARRLPGARAWAENSTGPGIVQQQETGSRPSPARDRRTRRAHGKPVADPMAATLRWMLRSFFMARIVAARASRPAVIPAFESAGPRPATSAAARRRNASCSVGLGCAPWSSGSRTAATNGVNAIRRRRSRTERPTQAPRLPSVTGAGERGQRRAHRVPARDPERRVQRTSAHCGFKASAHRPGSSWRAPAWRPKAAPRDRAHRGR